VVGVLILDVAEDGGDLRGAYAEGGVAYLPCEFVALGVGPAGGIRFDCQDGFGQGEGWRKLEQEMDVVGGAADGVREDSVIFADAGDVGPEVWLKILRNGFAAVFGGEDDVEGVLGVGVRHGAVYIMWGAWFLERDAPSDAGIFTYEACVAPTALGIFLRCFPGLPAWAKLCRAYGAGLARWTRVAAQAEAR
jgi:hypothetical protein